MVIGFKRRLQYPADCEYCGEHIPRNSYAYYEKDTGVWCLKHSAQCIKKSRWSLEVTASQEEVEENGKKAEMEGVKIIAKSDHILLGDQQAKINLLTETCPVCASPSPCSITSVSHIAIADSKLTCLRAMSLYRPKARDKKSSTDDFSSYIIKAKLNSRYARMIAAAVVYHTSKNWPEVITYDIVIPVPSTRGTTNQTVAEKMASFFAERFLLTAKPDILVCKSSIKLHTKQYDSIQRKSIVEGKFALKTNVSLTNKQVIIVNDLVSSGSTISHCANLLARIGASKIIGIVAGRTMLN